jgi:hypothetical protein
LDGDGWFVKSTLQRVFDAQSFVEEKIRLGKWKKWCRKVGGGVCTTGPQEWKLHVVQPQEHHRLKRNLGQRAEKKKRKHKVEVQTTNLWGGKKQKIEEHDAGE